MADAMETTESVYKTIDRLSSVAKDLLEYQPAHPEFHLEKT
jgi:hypothetical protein